MAEVVGPELYLKPFIRMAWRDSHDAGVRYQNVQTGGVEVLKKCVSNTLARGGEVARNERHFAVGVDTLRLCNDFGPCLRVAASKVDVAWVVSGKSEKCCFANAGGSWCGRISL